jgi:hypothetical protein
MPLHAITVARRSSTYLDDHTEKLAAECLSRAVLVRVELLSCSLSLFPMLAAAHAHSLIALLASRRSPKSIAGACVLRAAPLPSLKIPRSRRLKAGPRGAGGATAPAPHSQWAPTPSRNSGPHSSNSLFHGPYRIAILIKVMIKKKF